MREPRNHFPAVALRDHILSYGVLEFPEGVSEPYFSPPIGLSGFIIHTINTRNSIVARIADRDHYTDEAVATGQVTCPVHGENVGQARILLIFFHPMGMYQLFGTNMAALTNTSMPLAELLGADQACDLISRLKANQEDEQQVQVLNDFFSGRIPIVNKRTTHLRKVLEYIHHRKGDVSVSELENLGNHRRKTLERYFKRMVGISPKVYCQIYRFRCLINLIQSQPGISWVRLSEEAGFYDQSHMSRYVKDYLKVSPNTIVQLDMRLINYLLSR